MAKRRREEEDEIVDEEDDGSEGSDEDDELIEEAIAAGAIKAQGSGSHVNNKAGLQQALEGVRQELPWIERLEVVSADPANIKNVNDDLQVELAFYGQALAAVVAARGELERLGVPHRRPDDYFAEMLKSDSHMRKVKDKLLLEKQKITAVEHRRKEKDNAAFNKQAAAEKARAKAQEKRANIKAVEAWRKGKDGNRPDLESEADLEKLFQGGSGAGAGAGSDKDRRAAKFKRQSKDKKYGHGGPKRALKANNSSSSASMKGFSVKKMKSSMPPGMKHKGGKGGKKNAGGNRPSKRARTAGRK